MAKIIKEVHECLKFRKSSIPSIDLDITQCDEDGNWPKLQKRRLGS